MELELYSPLSLDDSIQRVEGQLAGALSWSGNQPFWGNVEGDRFSLRLARGLRNPFAPYFRGRFEPTASGTVLRGECRVPGGAKVAAIVWGIVWLCAPCSLTLVVGAAWAGLFLGFGESLRVLGDEAYRTLLTLPIAFLGLPVVGVVFGVGFPLLFIALRRGDCERIVELLRDLLEIEETRSDGTLDNASS